MGNIMYGTEIGLHTRQDTAELAINQRIYTSFNANKRAGHHSSNSQEESPKSNKSGEKYGVLNAVLHPLEIKLRNELLKRFSQLSESEKEEATLPY